MAVGNYNHVYRIFRELSIMHSLDPISQILIDDNDDAAMSFARDWGNVFDVPVNFINDEDVTKPDMITKVFLEG